MYIDYYKYILQFDLAVIIWLSKYKLIETNNYVNRLVRIIEFEDSIVDTDKNNMVKYFVKNSQNPNFKINLFKHIIEKWMSIVCNWKQMDFKLTMDDYLTVKNNIGRTPNGLIGLCGSIASVSPFICKLDVDYESNRLINGGVVPFINHLSHQQNDESETMDIDDKMVGLYLVESELLWEKIEIFLNKINKIQSLPEYINNIILDVDVSKCIDNLQNDKINDLLANITPFPTTFYIVGSDVNKIISELEERGCISDFQCLLDSDREMMAKFIKENFHCLISRFRFLHIDIIRYLYIIIVNSVGFKNVVSELINEEVLESYKINGSDKTTGNGFVCKNLAILNTLRKYGIGGISNWCRVKCLHSHYAYCTALGLFDSVTLNFINSIK